MLKIQMLEQIVTKENVGDDAKIDSDRCKSRATHSRTGSLASDCGSAKCLKCSQLMNSSINSTHLYSNEQLLSRLRSMARKSSGSEDDDIGDVVEELSCLGRHANGILEKPDALYAATQDLFELLERVQCSRFDDQRCALQTLPKTNKSNLKLACDTKRRSSSSLSSNSVPDSPVSYASFSATTSQKLLEDVLAKHAPPYHQVVEPTFGGYWLENGTNTATMPRNDQELLNYTKDTSKLESIEIAKCYRQFFMQREHFNFIAEDEQLGPIILSITYETSEDEQDVLKILLRMAKETRYDAIPVSRFKGNTTPARIAQFLNEQVTVENFVPCICPKMSELLVAFDEHILVSHFKFGVLYQKFGQTTEEELFQNTETSPAFDEFLQTLGNRISLKDHQGYRGGLDTQNGQTGDEAIYEVYDNKEIIFHVSTLLPFTENDPQQVQRKRHIGNDIVAIVFQEENTPFVPDMIASHFLHAFIVVQPIVSPVTGRTERYKVNVTARNDVPFGFEPKIPENATFDNTPAFKAFLLQKLINAEMSCYRAEKFSKLEKRTRSSLLQNLTHDLKQKTHQFLGTVDLTARPTTPKYRFIDTVRKVLIARMKTQEKALDPAKSCAASDSSPSNNNATSKKSSRRSYSVSSSPDTTKSPKVTDPPQSDCYSCKSMPLELTFEAAASDTGSATPAATDSMTSSNEGGKSISLEKLNDDRLARQADEIDKLKRDKLELLRLNVIFQRNLKQMKEREVALEEDLAAAIKEIGRLRGDGYKN